MVATQIFFIFNPTWGNDPIWLIFFRWVEKLEKHWTIMFYCIWLITFINPLDLNIKHIGAVSILQYRLKLKLAVHAGLVLFSWIQLLTLSWQWHPHHFPWSSWPNLSHARPVRGTMCLLFFHQSWEMPQCLNSEWCRFALKHGRYKG